MKLQNKDLTVIQHVEAVIDGIGTVDWDGKCNHVRTDDGWMIFEAIHRTDSSKYLYLEAYPESKVSKVVWKYGKDEIKKYFIGEESTEEPKTTTVEVAEPEDARVAEKKADRHAKTRK